MAPRLHLHLPARLPLSASDRLPTRNRIGDQGMARSRRRRPSPCRARTRRAGAGTPRHRVRGGALAPYPSGRWLLSRERHHAEERHAAMVAYVDGWQGFARSHLEKCRSRSTSARPPTNPPARHPAIAAMRSLTILLMAAEYGQCSPGAGRRSNARKGPARASALEPVGEAFSAPAGPGAAKASNFTTVAETDGPAAQDRAQIDPQRDGSHGSDDAFTVENWPQRG